jgi:hypothetical protein
MNPLTFLSLTHYNRPSATKRDSSPPKKHGNIPL